MVFLSGAIVSSPGNYGHFGLGSVIDFKLTFTDAVYVSGGVPGIGIGVGEMPPNWSHSASYVSGSGTTELTFRMSVQPGQNGQIYMYPPFLNGASIKDVHGDDADISAFYTGFEEGDYVSTPHYIDTIPPDQPNITAFNALSGFVTTDIQREPYQYSLDGGATWITTSSSGFYVQSGSYSAGQIGVRRFDSALNYSLPYFWPNPVTVSNGVVRSFSVSASYPVATASGDIAGPVKFALAASYPFATAAGDMTGPVKLNVVASYPPATASGSMVNQTLYAHASPGFYDTLAPYPDDMTGTGSVERCARDGWLSDRILPRVVSAVFSSAAIDAPVHEIDDKSLLTLTPDVNLGRNVDVISQDGTFTCTRTSFYTGGGQLTYANSFNISPVNAFAQSGGAETLTTIELRLSDGHWVRLPIVGGPTVVADQNSIEGVFVLHWREDTGTVGLGYVPGADDAVFYAYSAGAAGVSANLSASYPAAIASGDLRIAPRFDLSASYPEATVSGMVSASQYPYFDLSASYPMATASGTITLPGTGTEFDLSASYPDPSASGTITLTPYTGIAVSSMSAGYDLLPPAVVQSLARYDYLQAAAASVSSEYLGTADAVSVLWSGYDDIPADRISTSVRAGWWPAARLSLATPVAYQASTIAAATRQAGYQQAQAFTAAVPLWHQASPVASAAAASGYESSAVMLAAAPVGYGQSAAAAAVSHAGYGQQQALTAAASIGYDAMHMTAVSASSQYAHATPAAAVSTGVWWLTTPASASISAGHDLLAVDRASITIGAPTTFEPDADFLFSASTEADHITTASGSADPIRLEVSTSMAENVWQIAAQIPPDQMPVLAVGNTASVSVAGLTFAANITGRSRRATASSAETSIEAYSTGRVLATTKPPADLPDSTTAALMSLGVSHVIGLPSAGLRSTGQASSALALASQIATDMGAAITSLPDGRLQAMPAWRATGAAWIIDQGDILELDETFVDGAGYNRITVSDGDDAASRMQTELVQDGGGWLLYVYGVQQASVRHTQISTTITALGWQDVGKTAQVEFINGAASLPYPVHRLDAVDWMAIPAGQTVTVDGASLLCGGAGDYGLAQINYTVRPLAYRITSMAEEPIQLIITGE